MSCHPAAIDQILLSPSGIAFDDLGTLYVADSETHTIRKMTPTGLRVVVGLTGQDGAGTALQSGVDGASVLLSAPSGVAIGPLGKVYFSEEADT